MGGMAALGILLSAPTLPVSARLGTWGPGDYRALEGAIPCHAGACETRSRHAASGHLQVPNSTYDLPGVGSSSGKAHRKLYCFQGCFRWLALLRSSACRPEFKGVWLGIGHRHCSWWEQTAIPSHQSALLGCWQWIDTLGAAG